MSAAGAGGDDSADQIGQYLDASRRAAYHEAAHAVVALGLRIYVSSVDMRSDGIGLASTWTHSAMLQWSSMLCVRMAGYLAEKRIGTPRAQRLAHAGSDLADMRKALAVVSGMHLQIVKLCMRDTLRILRDEWHAVEALAELCLSAADDERVLWLHASGLPELYAVLGGLPQGEKPIRRRWATIERFAAAYLAAKESRPA